jgi:hypothetical protein
LSKNINKKVNQQLPIIEDNPTNLQQLYKNCFFEIVNVVKKYKKQAKELFGETQLPFLLEYIHDTSNNATKKKKTGFRHSESSYCLSYLLQYYGGSKVIEVINGKKGNKFNIQDVGLNLPITRSLLYRLPALPVKIGLENDDTKRVLNSISQEYKTTKFFNLSLDEAALSYGVVYRGVIFGFDKIVYQKDARSFLM